MNEHDVHNYIPYRDSKLTRVLRDSLLDGKCQILVIITLNPLPSQFEETYNSLIFALKLKQLKVMQLDKPVLKPPLRPPVSDTMNFDTVRDTNIKLRG